MRKKEHSGSAAVIGAQLVILFILTVSLCVQSRKAAAENTYAVMEKSGEGSRAGEPEKAGEAGDSQKKKYIHWVEFNVPADVMEKAFRLDMGTVQEEVHFNWVELPAYLGAKYGGDFERFRQTDLDAVVEKLKSGAAMEEITKDMKYYAYYREAYGAVLDGMVGYFEQESGNNKVWLRKYGLKVFSPIAKNFPYSDYDDFGASRSYGFKRKHLGHDMMGQVGTPVIAVESGYVEALGWNQYGGWRVGIRSFDGKRYYYYAHMRQNRPYHPDVQRGAVVRAGDVIGYVGRTGYSTVENTNNITTNHLHIGLELIFDEAQKDGPNQVWIDLYELTKFLQQHRSPVVRVADTKEYYRAVSYSEPDVEAYLRGELPQPFPSKSESREGS